MEGMNERMGIFPSLLIPAREAAAKLLAGTETMVPIEGKEDFMVARKGAVEETSVYFPFEYEDEQFVIFEKGSLD